VGPSLNAHPATIIETPTQSIIFSIRISKLLCVFSVQRRDITLTHLHVVDGGARQLQALLGISSTISSVSVRKL